MIVNRKLDIKDTVRQASHSAPFSDNALTYDAFIAQKSTLAREFGLDSTKCAPNIILKPHQRDIVEWCYRGGRRAVFANFGLGKTVIQLDVIRLITEHTGGIGLIVFPLGVKQEFERDAKMLDIPVEFIRNDEQIKQANIPGVTEPHIFLTNYESVREGKVDPQRFSVVSLDEAGILRGGGGVKTFRETVRSCESVPYRFVATATPDPNDYIELLTYAEWLSIMDRSQAKTMFFKRDSTKADQLTLHAHREEAFWNWVATWAVFVQKPSDLGYDDTGYNLPPLDIKFHEIGVEDKPGTDRNGQGTFFRDASLGVTGAASEKRETINIRVDKMKSIISDSPEEHFLIWHDLEDERRAIERAIPDVVSIYGSQDQEERETAIIAFANGSIQHLAGKPVMIGAGVNLQRYCHRCIFLGIGFKFYQFIQGIHRVYRFLQGSPVTVDIIYASTEKRILNTLMDKWKRYNEQVTRMSEIIRKYGLSSQAIANSMKRSSTCERFEAHGENWRVINNDAVLEMPNIEDNSIGLVLTSVPFSSQYEYSPSLFDLGHTESNDHFWRQMDYLTPHLLRTLKPGRLALIHVKDRIVPGGVNGLGFQTVYPLHSDAITHYTRHGFAYIGMKTIVTDVVRENNQTYRLGWTEQCKDGTKMGVGMPEYLLIFRKSPTSNEKSYADEPVLKDKTRYTRSRWQIDAHGFTRSNGNRLLMPEDLDGVPHATIFKMFRKYSLENIYNFEHHVALGEHLEKCLECSHIHTKTRSCGQCDCKVNAGRLPVTFMLLQPQSWSSEVWSDITRMRTLNMLQAQHGRQHHLCPAQWDLCRRAIEQYSNPGDTILDPFVGIGSVAMIAVEMGRKAIGIELSPSYFHDACIYCDMAEKKLDVPSLYDLIEAKETTETEASETTNVQQEESGM